jgi:hypothetical protein
MGVGGVGVVHMICSLVVMESPQLEIKTATEKGQGPPHVQGRIVKQTHKGWVAIVEDGAILTTKWTDMENEYHRWRGDP